MAKYGIDKLEKAKTTLVSVCVGCVAIVGGVLKLLITQSKTEDDVLPQEGTEPIDGKNK